MENGLQIKSHLIPTIIHLIATEKADEWDVVKSMKTPKVTGKRKKITTESIDTTLRGVGWWMVYTHTNFVKT